VYFFVNYSGACVITSRYTADLFIALLDCSSYPDLFAANDWVREREFLGDL
jgi:hypothetical protein